MKRNLFYLWLMIPLLPLTLLGQGKKSSTILGKVSGDNIYMTWNKSTPETEMNNDVKALAEHGVTITYSDVKRNEKGEITAIKVTYNDTNGSKGSLEFDNKKPINTIKFYKQNDEVGFGEPSNSEVFNGNSFFGGSDPQKMMKEYHFNFNDDKSFPFGNSSGKTSSRIIIQKDGKKPLVLEDGNVIEGGDDYTLEELKDIKKNNKMELFSNEEIPGFQFNQGNNFGDLANQMKKMQEQIDLMMGKNGLTPQQPKTKTDDLENSKAEMQKAKQEMQDTKKEMEKAKKELEKAKSSLKTQKT